MESIMLIKFKSISGKHWRVSYEGMVSCSRKQLGSWQDLSFLLTGRQFTDYKFEPLSCMAIFMINLLYVIICVVALDLFPHALFISLTVGDEEVSSGV